MTRVLDSIPLRAAAAGVVTALVGATLPAYQAFLFSSIAALVILTMSMSLLIGVAGLLSLGSVAFMGIGGYGISMVQINTSLPLVVGVALVVAFAWVLGWILGTISMRLSRFYLALTTIGLIYTFQAIVKHGGTLFGEGYGLVAPPPSVLGLELGPVTRNAVAAFTAAVVIVLTGSLLNSRTGRALRTMRAHDIAAELSGIRLLRLRTSVFALSAAMAALAGCIYAWLYQAVSPETFDIPQMINVLAYTIVGGVGTVVGAVLGPMVLQVAPELFRPLQEYQPIFVGLLILLILIVSPKGLAGLARAAVARTGLPAHFERWRVGVRDRLTAVPDHRLAVEALRPRIPLPQPAEPAIDFDSVTVRYGGLLAVDRLTFSASPGALHGLIGPNGAGKTTALNALSGLVRVDDGEIRSGGMTIRRRGGGISSSQLAAFGVTRTFQTPLVVTDLSAVGNVMVGLHSRTRSGMVSSTLKPRRTRREEQAARALSLEALERVGFTDQPDGPIDKLPFGALRRLEIARALVSNPRVLLLDEPTSGLEMAAAEEVMRMLRDLQRTSSEAFTVLIVEHNVPLLFTHCDTVTAMVEGRDVMTSVPDDLRRDARVRASYLGDQIEAEEAVTTHESPRKEPDGVEAG